MTKRFEIYKCNLCGNIVSVVIDGQGILSCCGKAMIPQKEEMTDGALEKHIPVVEKLNNGYLVKIGEVPHPMVDEHYIQWIEVITKDRVYRKFLKPNEKPEAFFDCIHDEHFIVREYCNIHGLYKIEK